MRERSGWLMLGTGSSAVRRRCAAHANSVLSRADCTDALFCDWCAASAPPCVHIGRLRKKLDHTGPPLIRTVRGEGYQLVNHPPAATS